MKSPSGCGWWKWSRTGSSSLSSTGGAGGAGRNWWLGASNRWLACAPRRAKLFPCPCPSPCVRPSLRMPKIATEISGHRQDTVEAYEAAVVRVIHEMRRNPAEPLDLEKLARIASISKFHLVRVFDEITGTTPHHFLASLRIQRAKELLLNPDRSITDVCMEVGYNSLGTFSKTFSELVGLSPQEFRAMPKRLSAAQFATTVWRYLGAR